MTLQPPGATGPREHIVVRSMPWALAAGIGVVVGSLASGVGAVSAVMVPMAAIPVFDRLSGGSCLTHECGEGLGVIGLLMAFWGWLLGTLACAVVVPLVTRRRRTLLSAIVTAVAVAAVVSGLVLLAFEIFLYSGPSPLPGGAKTP